MWVIHHKSQYSFFIDLIITNQQPQCSRQGPIVEVNSMHCQWSSCKTKKWTIKKVKLKASFFIIIFNVCWKQMMTSIFWGVLFTTYMEFGGSRAKIQTMWAQQRYLFLCLTILNIGLIYLTQMKNGRKTTRRDLKVTKILEKINRI